MLRTDLEKRRGKHYVLFEFKGREQWLPYSEYARLNLDGRGAKRIIDTMPRKFG